MRRVFLILFSLTIWLILGTSISWADINNGLVSYWPFNDNLNDVTGHGYNGTMINGTVSYIQGIKGKAIKLPGTPDSRISIVPWIPVNSSLTISGWVKILNLNELWFGYMAPIYSSQDGDYSHGFFLRPITRQNELRIEFGIEAENHTGNTIYYTLDPIEFFGNWHHMAGVVDRENNQIRLYYDGQLVTTSILTTGAVYPTKSFIGSYDYITARDGHTRYVSPSHRLDEIRLYNRALTYDEIQELFSDVNTAPTVTTNSVSSITSNSAVCGGNVTSDGGLTVTARGVCWSTASNPTTANSKTTDGSGTGSFGSIIKGLNSNKKYYVRAYATNSVGTDYGSNIEFKTESVGSFPTVTTDSVSSITSNSAVCGGNVTSDGGSTVTARGVCWNTTPNPTTANSKTTDGSGTGNFTSNISGLNSNTKYYVRAYAANVNGTSYGAERLFTTEEPGQPEISINRNKLNFRAKEDTTTGPQTISVSNSGDGTLNWSATSNADWLYITPLSGSNSGTITVTVNSIVLLPDTYTGAIVITDPNAINSPQSVSVTLKVYQPGGSASPFGEFSTPTNGATVASSIPVTGWALDDIEITSLKIYNGDSYIGDAIFIEGARPDVEQAYSDYPMSYKAGWGYMLLSNFLPNGGNGTYTLYAKASDREGNEVTLGSKTIYCDNAHAVKPFGAIDTPLQGGIASGKRYRNWGWVLTPQPNMISFNGTTIDVWVDGLKLGHPKYNIYRSDVASFFPSYTNSNGAAGYFDIDTTNYSNGLHSIVWVATDSGGNSDGIGSRYFLIQNTVNSGSTTVNMEKVFIPGYTDLLDIPISYDRPIELIKGYAESDIPVELTPDNDGTVNIQCRELERIVAQVSLPGNEVEGYMIVGNQLMKLPIGSTLNKLTGRFSWIPGPGFIGTYRLVFIETGREGEKNRKNIMISILPKFYGE